MQVIREGAGHRLPRRHRQSSLGDPSPRSVKRRDERLVSSRLVSPQFVETSTVLVSSLVGLGVQRVTQNRDETSTTLVSTRISSSNVADETSMMLVWSRRVLVMSGRVLVVLSWSSSIVHRPRHRRCRRGPLGRTSASALSSADREWRTIRGLHSSSVGFPSAEIARIHAPRQPESGSTTLWLIGTRRWSSVRVLHAVSIVSVVVVNVVVVVDIVVVIVVAVEVDDVVVTVVVGLSSLSSSARDTSRKP